MSYEATKAAPGTWSAKINPKIKELATHSRATLGEWFSKAEKAVDRVVARLTRRSRTAA